MRTYQAMRSGIGLDELGRLLVVVVLRCVGLGWFVDDGWRRQADIQLPVVDPMFPIRVEGQRAVHWQQNAVEVWVVRQCVIQQGEMTARGNEAVLWVDRDLQQGGQQQRITVYLDGAAAVDFQRGGIAHPGTGLPAQSIRDRTWFGHLATRMPIDIRVPDVAVDPKERPAVYQRGVQAFDRAVGHVQLAQLTVQAPAEPLAQPPLAPITGMQKRIQVGPRSNAADSHQELSWSDSQSIGDGIQQWDSRRDRRDRGATAWVTSGGS